LTTEIWKERRAARFKLFTERRVSNCSERKNLISWHLSLSKYHLDEKKVEEEEEEYICYPKNVVAKE